MGIVKQILLSVLVIALFLLAAGGVGYYMYSHSPQVALTAIQEAAATDDWEKFQPYIDDEAVAETLYNDLQAADMMGVRQDPAEKKLAKEAAEGAHVKMVEAFRLGIRQIIVSGKPDEAELKKMSETPVPEVNAGDILHRAEAGYVKYKGCTIQKQGGKALLALTLGDRHLGRDLTLELELSPKPDGEGWMVTRIVNPVAYLRQIADGKRKKLAKLNAPIRAELESAVTIGQYRLAIGQNDEYGFSEKIVLDVPVTYDSAKPIASFTGTVTLVDGDANESVQPFTQYANGATKGEATIQITRVLNPFVRADSHLMKRGLSASNLSIAITRLDYADGTHAELYKDLPEADK